MVPSMKRSSLPKISPLMVIPWLTQAGALGETGGALAASARVEEGAPYPGLSVADCCLLSSGFFHIRHLHGAGSEAAELGPSVRLEEACETTTIVQLLRAVKRKEWDCNFICTPAREKGASQSTSAPPRKLLRRPGGPLHLNSWNCHNENHAKCVEVEEYKGDPPAEVRR